MGYPILYNQMQLNQKKKKKKIKVWRKHGITQVL